MEQKYCLEGLPLMAAFGKIYISINFIWAASKDWENGSWSLELLFQPCLVPPLSLSSSFCFSYSYQLGHVLYTSGDIFVLWSSPVC